MVWRKALDGFDAFLHNFFGFFASFWDPHKYLPLYDPPLYRTLGTAGRRGKNWPVYFLWDSLYDPPCKTPRGSRTIKGVLSVKLLGCRVADEKCFETFHKKITKNSTSVFFVVFLYYSSGPENDFSFDPTQAQNQSQSQGECGRELCVIR